MDRLLTQAEQALLEDKSTTPHASSRTRAASSRITCASPSSPRRSARSASARCSRRRGRRPHAATSSRPSPCWIARPSPAAARTSSPRRATISRSRDVDDRVRDFLRRANERVCAAARWSSRRRTTRGSSSSPRARSPRIRPTCGTAQQQLARAHRRAGAHGDHRRQRGRSGQLDRRRRRLRHQAGTTSPRSRAKCSACASPPARISMAKLSQSFNQRLDAGPARRADERQREVLPGRAHSGGSQPSVDAARTPGARLAHAGRGARRHHQAGLRRRAPLDERSARSRASMKPAPPPSSATSLPPRGHPALAPVRRGRDRSQLTLNPLCEARISRVSPRAGHRRLGRRRFHRTVDGTITDISVTGAEPAGIFEQAAMSAVRRWRYEPVRRDGQAVEQRAQRSYPLRDQKTSLARMTPRLLIVDRDPQYAEWLRHHLGVICADASVRVMTPDQFDVLRESLSYDEFDLVLLTVRLRRASGRPQGRRHRRCCATFARARTFPASSRSPKTATSSPPFARCSSARSTTCRSAC